MIEGVDYTIDEFGRFVFSASYLLKRGRCCQSGCRNCPFPSVELECFYEEHSAGDDVNE